MNLLSRFIWEIRDFLKYFQIPEGKKRLLIYSEHQGYWPYYEGIITELLDKKQDLVYLTSDPKDPIFSNPNPAKHFS